MNKKKSTQISGKAYPLFTREMKKDYTILIPNMASIHFTIIKHVFTNHGYKVVLLDSTGPTIAQEGLKYVHNDICYPAMLVIGQMIDALHSGKFDLDKTALVITQTGGGCRASNYLALLRKALVRANMPQIPVISLNLKGLEKSPGFKLSLPMLAQAFSAIIYGDLIMLLSNQTRPYEDTSGETDALVDAWTERLGRMFRSNSGFFGLSLKRNLTAIADDFAAIPITHVPKPRVGIVGEIYMKFAPLGNNNLEKFLLDEGCEVMVPGLLGFIFYGASNSGHDREYYGGRFLSTLVLNWGLKRLERIEAMSIRTVKKHKHFQAPVPFRELQEYNDGVIGFGCKMGEGWLLTAEMLELAQNGFPNIVCTQPFGCLPNHICGKGMFRAVKEKVPDANIVAIDYDPSAPSVNQENRIKLMLAVAREELEKKESDMSDTRSAAGNSLA